MTEYETRTLALIVAPKGAAVFSEHATEVRIQDDAGGEFVEVIQSGSPDCGKIKIDPDGPPSLAARRKAGGSAGAADGSTKGEAAANWRAAAARLARPMQGVTMDDPNMHAYGEPGPTDAEIGRQWREDSSLEKWFPITAKRLAALEAENAALKREAYTWSKAAETYAKQAQRTPLDPLDLEELWDKANADDAADEVHHAFARLLERAHGIGGEHG